MIRDRWVAMALAVLCVGFSSSMNSVAASPHWVRIYATRDAVSTVAPGSNATDYGAFQWLAVNDAALARLRSAGFSVVETGAPFTLDLGGRRFDPSLGVPAFGGGWDRMPDGERTDLRLVQFEGPLRQSSLDALRAEGIEPLGGDGIDPNPANNRLDLVMEVSYRLFVNGFELEGAT